MGSIAQAPSGVHKNLCTISESRGISKTIWGFRFEGFQMKNNHISLNQIAPKFMNNFSINEPLRNIPIHVQTYVCTTQHSGKISRII